MRHRKSPVTRLSNSAVQCRVDSGPEGREVWGKYWEPCCADIHLWNKPRETKGREKRGRGGWGGVGVGSGEWEREEKRTKSHNNKMAEVGFAGAKVP